MASSEHDPDGLYPLLEAASICGIERQRLPKWAEKGMPRHAGPDGGWVYRPSEVLAWRAKYADADGQVRTNGKGGRQPGSGRKPKVPTGEAPRDPPDPRPPKPDKSGGPIVGHDGGVQLPTSPDQLREWLSAEPRSKADLDMAATAFKLLKEVETYEIERGTLVPAEDARTALESWCVEIREAMLQVGVRVGAKGGELGLDQAGCARLRDLASDVVRAMLATVRASAVDKAGDK